MTEERFDHIKTKSDAIVGLQKDILGCVRRIMAILKKGHSPYSKVNTRRAFQIVAIVFEAAAIKNQIKLIKSQPIFPSGGLPIAGDPLKINNNEQSTNSSNNIQS